jgi:hypothetical protein
VFGQPICTPVLSTKLKRKNPNCLITQLLCNFPNFHSVKKVGLPLFFFFLKKQKDCPLSLSSYPSTDKLINWLGRKTVSVMA